MIIKSILKNLKYISVLEYKADITIRNFRDGLISSLMSDKLSNLHSDLVNAIAMDKINSDEEGIINIAEVNKVLEDLLTEFETADPTKKNVYVPFIAKNYAKGGWGAKVEDVVSKINPMLKKYQVLKQKNLLNPEHKDIMRFDGFEEFYDTVEAYEIPEDEVVDKGDSELIYEDDEIRVVYPKDETSACYYGQGTRWCTAATHGSNMFNTYNRKGHLYIILPKKPKYDGEKYQLHFETDSYMDEKDRPVQLYDILINKYPQLLDVFSPYVSNMLVFAKDSELQRLISSVSKVVTDHLRSDIDNDSTVTDENKKDVKYIMDGIVNMPLKMFRDYVALYSSKANYSVNDLSIAFIPQIYRFVVYSEAGLSDNEYNYSPKVLELLSKLYRWMGTHVAVLKSSDGNPKVYTSENSIKYSHTYADLIEVD